MNNIIFDNYDELHETLIKHANSTESFINDYCDILPEEDGSYIITKDKLKFIMKMIEEYYIDSYPDMDEYHFPDLDDE